MIKAVIFDMDGVLIDSEPLWQRTERALFEELGIDLTPELLQQTRGLRTEEMVKHWKSRFPLESVKSEELMQRYDERMVEVMHTEVELMDGAEETIRFFHKKSLPVALASCSTHSHIDVVLDRFGLRNYFDLVVSAADNMQGKPHPEIYLRTASLLGLDPSFCLAIEDSFFGMIAAKAARMKVVALPDPAEYGQSRYGAADLRIRSLHELNDITFEKLQRI